MTGTNDMKNYKTFKGHLLCQKKVDQNIPLFLKRTWGQLMKNRFQQMFETEINVKMIFLKVLGLQVLHLNFNVKRKFDLKEFCVGLKSH